MMTCLYMFLLFFVYHNHKSPTNNSSKQGHEVWGQASKPLSWVYSMHQWEGSGSLHAQRSVAVRCSPCCQNLRTCETHEPWPRQDCPLFNTLLVMWSIHVDTRGTTIVDCPTTCPSQRCHPQCHNANHQAAEMQRHLKKLVMYRQAWKAVDSRSLKSNKKITWHVKLPVVLHKAVVEVSK